MLEIARIKNDSVVKKTSCWTVAQCNRSCLTFLHVTLTSFFFRTTFSDFAARYGKHDAFKAIEKMKDREALFTEYMAETKKKEKESSKTKHDKVGQVYWVCDFAGVSGMASIY